MNCTHAETSFPAPQLYLLRHTLTTVFDHCGMLSLSISVLCPLCIFFLYILLQDKLGNIVLFWKTDKRTLLTCLPTC